MAKDTSLNLQNSHESQHICWTAIITGALVAVGLSFLFNLFGTAIGLSAFTVNDKGTQYVMVLGGVIGFLVMIVISMLVAGFVTGYLGGKSSTRDNIGALYGFTTWTLALLISAATLGTLTNFTTVYSHEIGNPVVKVKTASKETLQTVVVEATPTVTYEDSHNTTRSVSQQTLSLSAFVVFVLFFVGAVSTCIGAHWGVTCFRRSK